MLPLASGPAGAYAWHAPQPCVAKIALPGASCATVPTTVFGVAVLTPSFPQPARTRNATAQARVRAAPRRMRRESTDSNRNKAKHPSTPTPITSTGVSLRSSDTARPTSIASTAARRGLLVPIQTSRANEATNRMMLDHDLVALAHERCSRCPKSPESDPGPPPTACVTWLEAPSAASIAHN